MSSRKQQRALLQQLMRSLDETDAANDQEPLTDEQIEELARRDAEEMIRARRPVRG